VLDGDPALPPYPHGKQHSIPLHFWAMSIVAKRSSISVTAKLLFDTAVLELGMRTATFVFPESTAHG